MAHSKVHWCPLCLAEFQAAHCLIRMGDCYPTASHLQPLKTVFALLPRRMHHCSALLLDFLQALSRDFCT